MYRAPQKFGIKANKREMVDCFWEIAETAMFVSCPISPSQVIFG
jgi:hypothetical protein